MPRESKCPERMNISSLWIRSVNMRTLSGAVNLPSHASAKEAFTAACWLAEMEGRVWIESSDRPVPDGPVGKCGRRIVLTCALACISLPRLEEVDRGG